MCRAPLRGQKHLAPSRGPRALAHYGPMAEAPEEEPKNWHRAGGVEARKRRRTRRQAQAAEAEGDDTEAPEEEASQGPPQEEEEQQPAVAAGAEHEHGGPRPTCAPLRTCLLYTSPSPRDLSTSRMPSSA